MSTERRISFDGWTLNGSILSPTHARLTQHTEQIARLNSEQPMVTFRFPALPSCTLSIHRTFLISAGGPLRALVTGPFYEAATNVVTPDDSYKTFEVLYNFLYCLPIDMSNLPPDMPLVAHRWQLDILFQACFVWAESSQTWNAHNLSEHWMTVLSLVQPPRRFCLFFARIFGSQFDTVRDTLEERNWMWGSYNIWDIFRSRGMLKSIIHTIVHFANSDYSMLLMDVILSQLEDKLTQNEAEDLLNELDWCSSSCAVALRNAKADRWSAKGWRLLALTSGAGQESGGEDVRMIWKCQDFGKNFASAPVCETKEGFTYNGLSFTLSLQSWCWKDPLSLRMEIEQSQQSVLKVFGYRRVSAVVSAMEDSCSCGLFRGNKPELQEYSAEPWPHFAITGLTLDSFAKDGGVEFVLMDSRVFEGWRSHHQDCGLLVSVRLRVMETESKPREDHNSIKRRDSMRSETRRTGSFPRGHATCPCVRCRTERRLWADHEHLSSRSRNVYQYVAHGHLESRVLSLS